MTCTLRIVSAHRQRREGKACAPVGEAGVLSCLILHTMPSYCASIGGLFIPSINVVTHNLQLVLAHAVNRDQLGLENCFLLARIIQNFQRATYSKRCWRGWGRHRGCHKPSQAG